VSETEVYYFSGSGNSLYAAKRIAENLQANLHFIAAYKSDEKFKVAAKTLVFVFPLYDFKAPPIVVEFLSKIEDLHDKKIYALSTYGISKWKAVKFFSNELKKTGAVLRGGFALPMPHNGIGASKVSENENKMLYQSADEKIDQFVDFVKEEKEGILETKSILKLFVSPFFSRMLPEMFRFLIFIIRHGVKSLQLVADQSCTRCALCVRLCPVENITMIDNFPKWGDNCIGCMACVHFCPSKSVVMPAFQSLVPIHHPDITLKEMMEWKNNF
jgi:flavodoxin/formate hydrogenlyase subunit 6/NADH:ubiquinone oxidoreductase subunit I